MPHPNPSDHALHDATLIAGHAAGDLDDVARARADGLLAACGDCGDLRRDLVAIAAATRSAPAPAALHRDLRLAADQAARLRRGSWLRGFLRPFAAARSPIRPIAAACTSLGIVGLLVGVTLTGGPGTALFSTQSGSERSNGEPAAPAGQGQAGGNADEANRTQAPVPAAADATERAVAVEMSSGGAGRDDEEDKASIVPGPTFVAANSTQAAGGARGESGSDGLLHTPAAVAPRPPNPLIAGSLALLGIGLLLYGLRIASRRVR